MGYDVDRVSEQEVPVINLKVGLQTIQSARKVSLTQKPLSIKVKMTSDISVTNVPLKMIAKRNTVFGKPNINSITD